MLNHYFYLDRLGILMLTLVAFMGIIVGSFGWRYLSGDRRRGAFLGFLALLVASVALFVCADHFLLFLLGWVGANTCLVRLMIHKSAWSAARASGRLATRNFLLGGIALGLGGLLLARLSGTWSIQGMLEQAPSTTITALALGLLTVAAMTQSALWPFHRWLLSSLNSPTPVSAMMHAGLINGGGFLLVRFAPLFQQFSGLALGLFLFGLVSALMGSAWKLLQSDVKRMLACSTMGQMGFMVAQCGLGLYAAAMAHLCWHGLFKAYLFLSSGGAAKEPSTGAKPMPSPRHFLSAVICGALGSLVFSFLVFGTLSLTNTTLLISLVAWVACSQLALTTLQQLPKRAFLVALMISVILGGVYGLNVRLIEGWLSPLHLLRPQPLVWPHAVGAALFILAWIATLYGRLLFREGRWPRLLALLYVKGLNASQPHPATITTHRNDYHF